MRSRRWTYGIWDVAEGPRPRLAARALCAACFAALLGGLAACQPTETFNGDIAPSMNSPTGREPADVKYYPSDEPLRVGVQRFNEGAYGLSAQYFQDAVNRSPKDLKAWIGLAASYDHLARYDLADDAYRNAVRLGGETVQILNNQGYSYMLRGNLKMARAKFDAALKKDPGNATVLNNLNLLDSSIQYISRPPG